MTCSAKLQATSLTTRLGRAPAGLPTVRRSARPLFVISQWPILGAGLLLVALALSACSGNSDTWRQIEESGVLVFGLDPTYPPFEMAVEGELSGLDVDLAREIARDLGLEARFVHFGYDGLYDALATHQVDVLISALVLLPERTRDFAYSEPYFNAGQILITPADRPIDDLQELDGKRLALELGAQSHVLASTWQRRLPQLSIIPLGTADEAMSAVAAGGANAALVDAISGRLHLGRSPDLTWNGEFVTDEPFALVVRAEDEVLLERLNESLRRLTRSGQLSDLVTRWLDAP